MDTSSPFGTELDDSMPARAPAAGTALETLRTTLGGRIVNALLREGFTTVEQVAAASDNDLLDINQLGWPSVNAIRDAIAAAQSVEFSADGDLLLSGDQVRELATLMSTLAVYANARQHYDMGRRAQAFLETVLRVRPT